MNSRVISYVRAAIFADAPTFIPPDIFNQVEQTLLRLGGHMGLSYRYDGDEKGTIRLCVVGPELLRNLLKDTR